MHEAGLAEFFLACYQSCDFNAKLQIWLTVNSDDPLPSCIFETNTYGYV